MTHRTATALVFAMTALAATSARADDPTLVRSFDPAQGELPESVAVDDLGNLYLSMGSTVRRLDLDGRFELFGTLPIPVFALGVKVGADDCVYTASTSLDPTVVGAFVWRICQQGVVEQYAALDPSGGPNDLAFDELGNLYVTDPIGGRIFKIDPMRNVSVWLEDPLLSGNASDPALLFAPQGVNGIALDKKGDNLYVGNLDYGRILRVPMDCNGAPGAIAVVAEDPRLRGADGIAFDRAGTLYIAVGAQDQLVAVDSHGEVALLAQGGNLHGPSSLAFGTAGSSKRTLYITNLDFLRAFGFVSEQPQPGLLKMTRLVPGLRLR